MSKVKKKLTVKEDKIDVFEQALRRDNLGYVIEKFRNNKKGIYYYAELTKKEEEQIANAIKGYLDYHFADLSYGEQQALESILNSLSYFMRF